jgi:threonine dehydrogenase-like Zn-dependent dehydrogenase
VRYTPESFADAIDPPTRKKVDVSSLITAKYPLTKAVEAFKAQQAKEGIKNVIMNQE